MILKSKQFKHSEENLHDALGVPRDTIVICRERIFFSHFSNSLQSLELFSDRSDAPKELTTVTGDLQRTLSMITDPLEYEMTLMHFLNYHRMASHAFGHWKFQNDSANSQEDKLKLELLKLVSRLKDLHDKDDDDSDDKSSTGNSIDLDDVTKRIDLVKRSKFDFNKYMELLGHPIRSANHPDVDDMLRGLFTDGNPDF